MAAAAGIPAEAVGGKLWRIGGATDLREVLGMDRGPQLLKERGRWASDIAHIYARANMRDQLWVSQTITDASARAVEDMVAGWVQPTSFR